MGVGHEKTAPKLTMRQKIRAAVFSNRYREACTAARVGLHQSTILLAGKIILPDLKDVYAMHALTRV
jgi:hypothetical protein